MPSHDRRPRLRDILSGSSDFGKRFDSAAPADDLRPLPDGTYRCTLIDGRLGETKAGTLCYRIDWQVLEGPHRNRRVFHSVFLTDDSVEYAKRDLIKIGLHNFDMLRQPPPVGVVADLRVVVNVSDDGSEWNKVSSFKVVTTPASSAFSAFAAAPLDPCPSTEAEDPAERIGPVDVRDDDGSRVPF